MFRDQFNPERDKRHFAETHISAEEHRRARCLALGSEVLEKTRIYLDQKYWIFCRDAVMGRPQQPIHVDIWNELRALVASNAVVCPVTHPIFVETMKQGDRAKRKCSAKVIDELSQGVAILPLQVLFRTELYHLFMSLEKGATAVYPLNRLVWTYAGWVLGEMVPHSSAFDKATNNAIQKCMFDVIADMPFSTLVEALSDSDSPAIHDDETFYAKMNAETKEHQHEVTSFDVVFASEVAGILDSIRPEVNDLFRQHYSRTTGQRAPTGDSVEAQEAERLGVNLIYHAYRLKKLTTEFPALHIRAGIHAAIRSRTQPHKKGDHWDHLHAHAALGYCNAFFTEKNLCNLLSSRPLEYAAAYNCRVLWKETDVLSYVRSLAQ